MRHPPLTESDRTVLQVNTDEREGGAAQVAVNLLGAYAGLGWTPYLAVGRRTTGDPRVRALTPTAGRDGWSGAWHATVNRFMGLGRILDRRRGLESFRYPSSHRVLEIAPEPPDVVHLHNLHGGYFDLRLLSELSRNLPVVVTLHDAWMLSGHCAHSFGCSRWESGCGACPDLTIYPAVRKDRTALNWRRKRDVYAESRLYVATPSAWLMDKVERSILQGGILETRVIPNGVDLSTFKPGPGEEARRALGIPTDALVLLFVASGGARNEFKHYALLRSAIERVAARSTGRPLVFLALGGAGASEQLEGCEIRHLPFLDRGEEVARIYRASDAYIHAARADTFPNTVLEALACGTPVVATAVGGIPEQVRSLRGGPAWGGERVYGADAATGFLVSAGDDQAFAESILRLLADGALRGRLSENAARDARERFDLLDQARAYVSWFDELLDPGRIDGSVEFTAVSPTSSRNRVARRPTQPSDEDVREMVSVVTIFLNAESFLEEAVASVRAQTYGDWELLLVDDGSSDGSAAIARAHAERDPARIRYLAHPSLENRGMSASRNLGIEHARGEFLAFLDADDIWLPEKLERQVEILDRQPRAQMVYGPTRLWFGWTGSPDDAALDDWRRPGVTAEELYEPPSLLTLLLRGKANSPATCSVLIRKEAAEAVGGFVESFQGMYEDQAFFAKVFHAHPVYVSAESWDWYRQHPDSACWTAMASGEYHPDMPHPGRLRFLLWLQSFLSAQGAEDEALGRALEKRIWLCRHPRVDAAVAWLRRGEDAGGAVFWKTLVPFGFGVARRLLPASVRDRLWTRWTKGSS